MKTELFRRHKFPISLRYVCVISARCCANIKGVKYLGSCAGLASANSQVQSRALQILGVCKCSEGNFALCKRQIRVSSE